MGIMKIVFHASFFSIYCTNDPLLYRGEVQLSFIALVIAVVLTVPLALSSLSTTLVDLVTSILQFIFNIIIIIAIPGISLGATFYYDISLTIESHRTKKIEEQQKKKDIKVYNPEVNSILLIMSNPQTSVLFKEFSMKEFSIENIMFWEEVQQYKKIKPKYHVKRFKCASRIFSSYLDGSAVMEVNIPQSARNEVKQKIDSFLKENTELPNDLFEKCENTIISNMIDIYARFYKSQTFQQYITSLS